MRQLPEGNLYLIDAIQKAQPGAQRHHRPGGQAGAGELSGQRLELATYEAHASAGWP